MALARVFDTKGEGYKRLFTIARGASHEAAKALVEELHPIAQVLVDADDPQGLRLAQLACMLEAASRPKRGAGPAWETMLGAAQAQDLIDAGIEDDKACAIAREWLNAVALEKPSEKGASVPSAEAIEKQVVRNAKNIPPSLARALEVTHQLSEKLDAVAKRWSETDE